MADPESDATARERNESGQFADALDPETVLDVFDGRTDQSEPLDAGDVADALDWSRRTALRKLDSLTEEGRLRSKKAGSGRVWWVPHATQSAAASAREAETDRETDSINHQTPDEETEAETKTFDSDDIDGQIEELDLPGAADSAEGRAAVRACYQYIRDHGAAKASDLKADVYPDHDLDVAKSTWWEYVGKDAEGQGEGLQTLAEARDDLDPGAEGGGRTYQFVADEQGASDE